MTFHQNCGKLAIGNSPKVKMLFALRTSFLANPLDSPDLLANLRSKFPILVIILIALALPSSSLFSQWASSAWASYGTLYVDTNRSTDISPHEPVTGNRITCTLDGYVNESYKVNLTWYRNTVLYTSGKNGTCHFGRCSPVNNSIGAPNITKGDVWNCTAVLYWNSQGRFYTFTKSSKQTVQNTPIDYENMSYIVVSADTVGDYSSSPASPVITYTNSSLLCSAGPLSDPDAMDNQTLYYQWYVNGRLVDPSNRLKNTKNLTLHLDFDEGEGDTVYDKSGKGNDGALTNMDPGTDWVAGKYGYGLDFDGINDLVNSTTTGFNSGAGSLDSWVKLATVAGNHTIFSAPQEGAEIAAGLVGYWRFNNDSSVGEAYNATNASLVYDYSGFGNNGQNYNATYNASGGKFGGAFEFDGVDDYVEVPDSSVFTLTDFSASVWFKSSGDTGYHQTLVGNYDANGEWIILYMNVTLLRLHVDDGSNPLGQANATKNYIDNTWHHLVGVRNTGQDTLSLFVDGVLVNSVDDATDLTSLNSNEPFKMGYQGDTQTRYFNGTIDEVRIYNRTLSAEEIKGEYLGLSLFKHDDNLVFHAGNATLWYDVSSWSSVWHHVSATYENSTSSANFYLDGSSVNSTGFREGGNFNSNSYIGSDWRGNASYTANGTIDEIKLHSAALSDADVRYSYKAGYFGLSRDYIHKGDDVECALIVDETGAEGGSLVAYWGFDESTGNITYDYTGRNNGTCYNASHVCNWTRFGKYRSGIVFDGTDDYINISDSASLRFDGNFTISFWVKEDPFNETQIWLAKRDNGGTNYQLYHAANGTIQFYDGNSACGFAGVNMSDYVGEWTYITYVIEGSTTVKLYINAIYKSSDTTSVSKNDANILIGRYHSAAGTRFNGTLDSIAIWNRTLSQAEIQSHYTSGIQLLSSRRTTFESRQLDFSSGVAGITYADNASVWKHDMNWTTESGNLTLGGGHYGDDVVLLMDFDRNCTGVSGACVKDWSGLGNNGTVSNAVWNASGKIGGAYQFDGIDDVINITWS